MKKSLKGLDIITTPIMMCNKNEKATVIYKNLNARERVKIPTLYNGMYKHIQPFCMENYNNILNNGKPKVITLSIENILNDALVGNYIFNDEPVTIWIFLDMLQINSYNSFFGHIIDRDDKIFTNVTNLVDYFIKNDNIQDIYYSDSRYYKIQNIMASIINELFDSMPVHKNKLYNIFDNLDIIVNQSKNMMSKLGYRFMIITDRLELGKYANLCMNDFGTFIAVYVRIIALGINLSYNKEGYVELYTNDRHLIIEMNITLIDPPFFTNDCSDIDILIKTFPQECFNIILFEQYIKYKSWNLKFDITDDERNNFKLRIYVDLINDNNASNPILRTTPEKGTEFDCESYDVKEFINKLLNIHLS